jgi:hypothetical protein
MFLPARAPGKLHVPARLAPADTHRDPRWGPDPDMSGVGSGGPRACVTAHCRLPRDRAAHTLSATAGHRNPRLVMAFWLWSAHRGKSDNFLRGRAPDRSLVGAEVVRYSVSPWIAVVVVATDLSRPEGLRLRRRVHPRPLEEPGCRVRSVHTVASVFTWPVHRCTSPPRSGSGPFRNCGRKPTTCSWSAGRVRCRGPRAPRWPWTEGLGDHDGDEWRTRPSHEARVPTLTGGAP